MKLERPNYTQIPNIFLDEWMCRLKRESTVIFLAICRKTIGWQKNSDSISYSQLKKLTEIRMGTIKIALDELEEAGLVTIDKTPGKTNRITLNMEPLLQVESTPPTGGEVTPPTGGETKEIRKETIQNKQCMYSKAFEEFWEMYPRQENKKGAYRKWIATKKREKNMDTVMQGVEVYIAECKRKKTSIDFILHPATFLGPDEHWREYAEKYKPPKEYVEPVDYKDYLEAKEKKQ